MGILKCLHCRIQWVIGSGGRYRVKRGTVSIRWETRRKRRRLEIVCLMTEISIDACVKMRTNP